MRSSPMVDSGFQEAPRRHGVLGYGSRVEHSGFQEAIRSQVGHSDRDKVEKRPKIRRGIDRQSRPAGACRRSALLVALGRRRSRHRRSDLGRSRNVLFRLERPRDRRTRRSSGRRRRFLAVLSLRHDVQLNPRRGGIVFRRDKGLRTIAGGNRSQWSCLRIPLSGPLCSRPRPSREYANPFGS